MLDKLTAMTVSWVIACWAIVASAQCNEKVLREMQTLCTGCSKTEPKIFAPLQTPSRRCGTTKIQSAGDGHYLYLQTQFGQDRCMQFRVIMVTDPTTNRQDRLQYTAPLAGAQCNKEYETIAGQGECYILSGSILAPCTQRAAVSHLTTTLVLPSGADLTGGHSCSGRRGPWEARPWRPPGLGAPEG